MRTTKSKQLRSGYDMQWILVFLLSCITTAYSYSQDTKRVAGANITINGQHPDNFIFQDDKVDITFKGGASGRIDLEIYNNTNESIDFLWDDTHVVIEGSSYNVENVGISGVRLKAFHTEYVDKTKPQRIAPKSSYLASMKTGKFFFSIFEADRLYKEKQETLFNRAIPVLLIDGEKVDYPISFEFYSKRHLKDIKSND